MMLKKVESAKEKKWKRMTGGDVGIPPGTEYDLPQLKGAERQEGGRNTQSKWQWISKSEKKKEGDTVY